MVTFSNTLTDILSFADKYGADITELLRLISRVASQSGMRRVGGPSALERRPGAGSTRANLPAAADRLRPVAAPVAAPAKPVTPVALSDDEMFAIVQQRWLGEPDGFTATGRAYYRRCGFVMAYNSKRFANWLLRDGDGEVVGISGGRYIFRRSSSRGVR